MKQGQDLIDNLLRLVHIIDTLAQDISLQEHEIQHEIERSSHVDPEVVQTQNVPLKIHEHLIIETTLKKWFDIFQRQHHLLVVLDGDFEGHGIYDSHEGGLDWLVVAQVIVSQVNGLQNCLVQTIGLHRELQDWEDGFLPVAWRNAPPQVFFEVVSRAVLKIDIRGSATVAIFFV